MGGKKIFGNIYYNEVGIKISSLRFSVRFPCAPSKPKMEDDYEVQCKNMDHYRSDWTWVPVQNQIHKPTSKQILTKRPLPPPPVPPRAASPSLPPSSALPPYPSSTVSRKSSSSSLRSSLSSRTCSFV